MAQTHVDRNSRARSAAVRAKDKASLTCSACQGNLVADLYIDTMDAGGHVWVRALRCVRCRKIAGRDHNDLSVASHKKRIGRIPRELPEWGLNDEMTALGT